MNITSVDLMKLSERDEPMSTSRITASAAEPAWLGLVREKVEGLNYGVVQIVVHDHKVTQIERTEKTRIDPVSVEPSLRHESR